MHGSKKILIYIVNVLGNFRFYVQTNLKFSNTQIFTETLGLAGVSIFIQENGLLSKMS